MKKIPLIFALSAASIAFSQSKIIEKVEPAFWWKDMKNPELQILVYGKDVAHNDIVLSDNIPVKDIQKVENPNYVFVTVNTNEINVPQFTINIKKGKKNLGSYHYELKSRNPGSADRGSFSSKDVMYLIMPDRFANGDEKNDSSRDLTEKADRTLPNGRHGGDLKGIINNLDYIQNLGATAVWLTPVNEDNEKVYSYHGYAQTDLYKIDARYGTNDDYKNLSRELNKRNMKLVMDYVTNHWGISHWMIRDLPSKDWIHWFADGEKGFKRSNYKTTTQFDPNASEIDKKYALNGWFDTTMPDINQKNPLVLKYLTQNAIWWIEYAELGGFRVDTYPYNDKEAMAKWAKAITDEYPKFNIVGETWLYTSGQISAWQKDSKTGEAAGYNSNLPSVMDFMLFADMPKALQEKESWNTGMIKLYDSFTSDFLYPDINNLLVFFENHDTERWNEIFNADPKAYRMGLTLISTVRGIPQIYYGSEIGMRGDKNKGGDADIRRDFPGGWKSDQQNAFNPATQTPEQKEFFDFTQKILNWRKNKEVIHTGKTKNYVPQDGVFTYFRYNEKESVMVMLNNNDKDQQVDLKRFEESLQGFSKGKEVMSGKEWLLQNSIVIPARSSLIIELKK
ncbi:alpha-amlyase [Chryseobacterium indologenes]|uniref:Alpha-amlyase n=1 Tax=Chryseobacterium indologenes TaxID=253 RepID=A0AAD1DTJ6_CHRID|nr:glycoside hydrolase family 13 protein [Chryseobacterium indologenes]AYZ36469.1 alpha-amlyase [Chryseobacterium indologenes]AZB16301.1 alpha-amlyase [Chryseobacterium indologenes]MBF6645145.1 glycoside hydrolase family 13 protein [Chryseobacterium indologenes]MBU3048852.1 glycoside hydrolase family 13 protein [Chryseobacterium indologenes]MEB4759421.1 glycoside hydrolase family 13 protein [Chryseobacterium indologenes]